MKVKLADSIYLSVEPEKRNLKKKKKTSHKGMQFSSLTQSYKSSETKYSKNNYLLKKYSLLFHGSKW